MRSDVTDELLQATFEIGRSLRKRMLSIGSKDMHMGQLHALAFIQEKGDITMTQLAAMLQISSPSATSFIDRLVQLKFVERRQDQKNRKLVRLAITPSGKKILKTKMAEKKKMFEKLLSALSPTDQVALLAILRKMLSHSPSA